MNLSQHSKMYLWWVVSTLWRSRASGKLASPRWKQNKVLLLRHNCQLRQREWNGNILLTWLVRPPVNLCFLSWPTTAKIFASNTDQSGGVKTHSMLHTAAHTISPTRTFLRCFCNRVHNSWNGAVVGWTVNNFDNVTLKSKRDCCQWKVLICHWLIGFSQLI